MSNAELIEAYRRAKARHSDTAWQHGVNADYMPLVIDALEAAEAKLATAEANIFWLLIAAQDWLEPKPPADLLAAVATLEKISAVDWDGLTRVEYLEYCDQREAACATLVKYKLMEEAK